MTRADIEIETVLEALSRCLSAEALELRAGRLATMTELAPMKARSVEQLLALGVLEPHAVLPAALRARLDNVQRQARENASLMDAVRTGLVMAIQRLAPAAGARDVGAYGVQGRRVTFDRLSGGYSAKA